MIHIRVFNTQIGRGKGEWTDIPNGPFPITAAQLEEARRLYREEWAACPGLSGVRVSPQTAARALLRRVCPGLSDFDAGMIGFAVSNDRIRTKKEKDGKP